MTETRPRAGVPPPGSLARPRFPAPIACVTWAIRALGLIWPLLLGWPACAEPACPLPDNLVLHDISLPAAKQAVADTHRLVVLTFGGVRPAGTDADTQGSTYPARLAAELSSALPQVEVKVVNEPPPGQSAADVPAKLPGLIETVGASVVIWGPGGGRDAAAHLDLDVFLSAVNSGIDAVRHAGADLILLDATFVPSPARMALIETYRQKLLAAAAPRHVPVLPRHDMMRLWSEDGTLNLAARDPAEREQVVRHLFFCVAKGLATPIAAAVR